MKVTGGSGGGGSSSGGQLVRVQGDQMPIDTLEGRSGRMDNLILDVPTNAYGATGDVPSWVRIPDGFTDRVELDPGTYVVIMDNGVTVIGYEFTGEEMSFFPSGTGSGGSQPYMPPSDLSTELYGLDPEGWVTERFVSVPEGSTTRNKLGFNVNVPAPLNSPYPADGVTFCTVTIVKL